VQKLRFSGSLRDMMESRPDDSPSEKTGDIFDFADKIVKKRKIAPLSLKEVGKIIHDVRRTK
jgi:hypothetical protein